MVQSIQPIVSFDADAAMEARLAEVFILAISCLFFVLLVAGGVLFLMYVFLPETKYTSWYPIVAMVFVGIPWLFWFATFVCRCFVKSELGGDQVAALPVSGGRPTSPKSPGFVGHAKSPTAIESPVNSPGGGARRVRFGGAVVMGSVSIGGGPGGTGAGDCTLYVEGGHGVLM